MEGCAVSSGKRRWTAPSCDKPFKKERETPLGLCVKWVKYERKRNHKKVFSDGREG